MVYHRGRPLRTKKIQKLLHKGGGVSMRKMICLLLSLLLVTSGCLSQGKRVIIPVAMPGDKEPSSTIIAFNQYVPTMFVDPDTYKGTYLVKGNATTQQMDAIDALEKNCHKYVQAVHPHHAVVIAIYVAIFAAAGAAGGGLGSLAFEGASALSYAAYSGAAGGMFGVPYALTILAAKSYTFESCASSLAQFYPQYGLRVIVRSPY